MAKLMFTKDFSEVFTQAVNEYIAKGMIFHISSMRGHQGEEAKADLTDGKDVYRIYLYKDCCMDSEAGYYGNRMTLRITKHEDEYSDKYSSSRTIWNDDGKVIFEKSWFEIGKDVYTESYEEAIACHDKHLERYHSRMVNKSNSRIINVSDKNKTIIKNMCRGHKGYARTIEKHIDYIMKTENNHHVRYSVIFNNGKEALAIKDFEK